MKTSDIKVPPARCRLRSYHYTQPSAESIIEFIHKNHPNIATTTVYKVLDILVENKLIQKIKTDKNFMRKVCSRFYICLEQSNES